MCRLSADYLHTVEQYEQRIADLRDQLHSTEGAMNRYRLRKRIIALQTAVNDMRYNAHICATYYDNNLPKRTRYSAKTTKKQPCGAKKRFSRHGYGLPTPAAAGRRRDVDKPAVSGLGAVLLRGTDTAGSVSDT